MVNDSWPAIILTLIWVGFLRVRFEVGGGGGENYSLSKTH